MEEELLTKNLIANSLDRIKDFTGLDAVNIIEGGPSIADPLGIVKWYISFRGKGNTGFWFSIGMNGEIIKCGATINGKPV